MKTAMHRSRVDRRFYVFACLGLLYVAAVPAQRAAAQTYNYGDALQKAIYFYDEQRSGVMPPTNRVEWRGNSATGDGSDNGVDLTGGWYDAGDNMKFNFPMAFSTTMLAWGVVEYRGAYVNLGQLNAALDNIRWACDYFIKCHTAPNVLYGQCGLGSADHAWWGPAEVMQMARPSYKIDATHPGSDLAGETAAALAAASMAFQPTDPAYASTLLTHAQQLYTFADTYRGTYDSSITDAANYYKSFSGYMDELTWGAAWLYRATGDTTYLTKAETYYPSMPQTCAGRNNGPPCMPTYKWGCAWDDKSFPTHVLMAELTNQAVYIQDSERWLNWLSVGGTEWGADGTKVAYTPGGMAHVDVWGALRYADNSSFCAMVFSDWFKGHGGDGLHVSRYHDFAVSQINYTLGTNPLAESFIVGFGGKYPQFPHHRSGHGSWSNNTSIPAATRHNLYGALVGGPDISDAFNDARTNYQQTEPACDYNSGLVGLLARMYQEYGGTPTAGFPATETRDDDEFYVQATGSTSGLVTTFDAYVINKSAWPAKETDSISFRYYFTLDGTTTPSQVVASADFTSASPFKITGPFLVSGSTYYFVFDMTGTKIFPGDNLGGGGSQPFKEVKGRITSTGTWSAANDWSFTGLNGTMTKTTYIPLYNGGVKLFGNEGGAPAPPPVPTGVSAAAGNTQIALSWAASSGATTYNVKRSTVSGGPYTTVASPATTSFTNSGLTNGTTYYYVVSAVNSVGESANSSQVSATPATVVAPAPPTGLTATTGKQPGKLSLAWTQSVTSGVTQNKVYRATVSGGPYSLVTTLAATTSFGDSGLTSGATYYYVVTAVSANGESGNSNQASAAAK